MTWAKEQATRLRFWDKVAIDFVTGCWNWRGAADARGYGYFAGALQGQQIRTAHRFAYTDAKGPIPPGLVLDHLCRNPSCVRPAHLEAVTERVNLLRGVGPTATNSQKTHCVNGHEFDDANTYVCPDGWRQCRACRRQRNRSRRSIGAAS